MENRQFAQKVRQMCDHFHAKGGCSGCPAKPQGVCIFLIAPRHVDDAVLEQRSMAVEAWVEDEEGVEHAG